MKVKKYYLYLLFIFIFTEYAYSNENAQLENNTHDTWVFLKVSQKNIFGDTSRDSLQSLGALYSQVKIILDNKKLTITNSLLEQEQICFTDYLKIKKTPLEYFYSQKTKDLYSVMFKQEHIPLSNEIYILTASKPDQECKAPYNEIIENNGYLVLIDQDHLLFFINEKNNKASLKDKSQFKNDFPRFCKDVNEGKTFDGSSQYICNYPNTTLLETYLKVKNIMDDGQFMMDKLPSKTTSIIVNNVKVTYEWIKSNTLKLIVEHSSETTTYLFEEKQKNTKLAIRIDTGY